MGKHKNATQIGIFLDFMEQNPDVAKGFTKRNKSFIDSLWLQLTGALNASGPPQKDVNGWKKVWTEWKWEVKKKLAHNKNEARATGGGPFTKHHLSQAEETIARICGLVQAVDGVPRVSLGEDVLVENALGETVLDDADDDIPSTSSKRKARTVSNTPKRHRPETISQRLSRFLDEDGEKKTEVSDKLDKLIKVQKENASSLRRLYRSNESVAKAVTELTSVNIRMLTAMQEQNEIKRKQLSLELLKFNIQQRAQRDT